MRKHWRLSLLLALAAMLLLFTLQASAAEDYGIWFDGQSITSENLSGDGWSYDAASNTLTLTNYTSTNPSRKEFGSYHRQAFLHYDNSSATLNLKLVGTCTFGQASDASGYNSTGSTKSGIYAAGGLSIQADSAASLNIYAEDTAFRVGTLTVNENTAVSCTTYGTSVQVTSLYLSGGTFTVQASCKEAYGVFANSAYMVSGELSAVSSNPEANEAISLTGNLVVNSDSKVTATTANTGKSGMHLGGLTISSSSNRTAIVTSPYSHMLDISNLFRDGNFYNSENPSNPEQTVTITGLRRCTLYLVERPFTAGVSYRGYTFVEGGNAYIYSSQALDFSDSSTLLSAVEFSVLKNVVVYNGSHKLVLDDFRKTDAAEPFLTVNAGASLELQLKGQSLLMSESSPLITNRSSNPLKLTSADSSGTAPSLSVISGDSVRAIDNFYSNAYGPVVVDGCTLSAASKNYGVNGPLTVNGGYAEADVGTTLTMNGGAFCGTAKDIDYQSGSLHLSSNAPDKDKNNKLKTEVELYQAAALLKGQQAASYVASYFQYVNGGAQQTNKTFPLASLQYGSTTLSNLPLFMDATSCRTTVYLPSGSRVANAVLWTTSSSTNFLPNGSEPIPAGGSGRLYNGSGVLYMQGTIALRKDPNSSSMQICSDYQSQSTAVWIDYNAEKGLEMSNPNGDGELEGVRLWVASGTHLAKLKNLKLKTPNSIEVEEGGTLTLELPAGTDNSLDGTGSGWSLILKGTLNIQGSGRLTFRGANAFHTYNPAGTLNLKGGLLKNDCSWSRDFRALNLNVTNGTLLGFAEISSLAMVSITGGSVQVDQPEGTTFTGVGGVAVTRTDYTLAGVTEISKVTDLVFSASYAYGTNDIYTDASGRLYLWLPEGVTLESAKIGDTTYTRKDTNTLGGMTRITAPTEGETRYVTRSSGPDQKRLDLKVYTDGSSANVSLDWQVQKAGDTAWTSLENRNLPTSGNAQNHTSSYDILGSGESITGAIDGKRYRCVVTDQFGSIESPVWTFYYYPEISVPDVTAAEGSDAVLNLAHDAFTGGALLAYDEADDSTSGYGWYQGGTLLGRAQEQPLSAVSASQEGEIRYVCAFRCSDGHIIPLEAAGKLWVVTRPVVTAEPEDCTKIDGETAVFTVEATGNHALSYRWEQSTNGTDWAVLPGETGSTLTVSAAPELNGRQYRCTVINTQNDVSVKTLSRACTLTVHWAPTVARQPQSVTVQPGERAVFTVEASACNPPAQYQWYCNGVEISGATEPEYVVPAAAKSMDGDRYTCRVYNEAGGSVSEAAVLYVNWAPELPTQPEDASAVEGERARFRFSADANPAPAYQWQVRKGGGEWENLPGETGAELSLVATPAMNDWAFRCVASNRLGSLASSEVRLAVETAFARLSGSPSDTACAIGQKTVFTLDTNVRHTEVLWTLVHREGSKTEIIWEKKSGADEMSYDFPEAGIYECFCTVTNPDTGFQLASNRLTLSMFNPALVETPEMSFRDVSPADWFYSDVRYAWENGLMSGTGADTFGPQLGTSRAMLVTVLYRMVYEPGFVNRAEFTDVPAGSYYAAAVSWAAENGIVTGYADGTFRPDRLLSREEVAAILYRFAAWRGQSVTAAAEHSSFRDAAQISAYAQDALRWAVASGVLSGRANGTLAPKGAATRAEIAAILHRFALL